MPLKWAVLFPKTALWNQHWPGISIATKQPYFSIELSYRRKVVKNVWVWRVISNFTIYIFVHSIFKDFFLHFLKNTSVAF